MSSRPRFVKGILGTIWSLFVKMECFPMKRRAFASIDVWFAR